MEKDSIFKVFGVAALVCVVCSILVSLTATTLKPKQAEHALLDKQVNVLKAAGLVELSANPSATEIKEKFSKIEPVVIDTLTGETTEGEPDKLDIETQLKTPALSNEIPAKSDIAGIKKRPNQSVVYLLKDDSVKLSSVVLPVYGRGLWSTLYGFLSLDADLETVKNLTFYKHGETPAWGERSKIPTKWRNGPERRRSAPTGNRPSISRRERSRRTTRTPFTRRTASLERRSPVTA